MPCDITIKVISVACLLFQFLRERNKLNKKFWIWTVWKVSVFLQMHVHTPNLIYLYLSYLMITHVIASRYVWFSSINWYSENLFQVLLYFKLSHLTWECSQEVSLLHDVLWNQHTAQTKLNLVLDKQIQAWSKSGWPEWMCHILLWVIDDLS